MKKHIFSIVIFLFLVNNIEAQSNFYYANCQRQYWRDDSTSINIIVANMQNYNLIVRNLQTFFSSNTDTVRYGNDDDNIIVISDKLMTLNLPILLSSISQDPTDISFVTYAKKIDNRRIWLRNEAYVKLKNNASYSTYLMPFMSHFSNYSLDYDDEENDYKITCNNETILLQIANGLYDTQYVYYSSPDFYCEMSLNALDPYYGNQWALNNIGQEGGEAGIDIKAEKAWDFLLHYNNNLGDSVRVAVIDAGVESHEDLNDASGNSRVKKGYPSWWGQGTPYDSYQYHGQACAGIIAASHNSIGIAGIAPNSLIVPIRIQRDTNTFFSAKRIQKAITKAWETYNAQILSNSWGGDYNDFITCGFQKAMQEGRGGKGCVVVIASGNKCRSYVEYPASITGVIAVGATDRCGQRAGSGNCGNVCESWPNANVQSGSSYGNRLSVVAPGTHVYTIDRMGNDGLLSGNYNPDFNGTSAACPHVSGVAALVLSINPSLTHSQVKEIIEKTAQKVGSYSYNNYYEHPNGKWHDEMGYGMVNAYHALAMAKIYSVEYTITGPEFMQLCNEYTYTLLGDVPEGYEIVWETNLHLCIVSGQGTNSLVVRPLYPATGNRIKVKICYDGYVIREKEIYPIASSGTGIYPVTNYDTVITSNVLWDIERSLGNVVTIDSGAVLTITNAIHCTDNTRLIVRPGGKLVVDGGTLTSACDGEMWQGIEVVGDRTKRQIPQWQGKVELRNGAKIENALCGIYAGLRGDTVNFATTGGIILADSAYFTNNRRAVEINSYAYTTPSGGIANYVSSFKNCTFTVDDNNLLAANDTVFSEHVKLWDVKGVSFEGCTFLNQTGGLSDKGRGIYAHDAGIVLDVKCNGDGAMAVGLCGCLPEWSDSCVFNGFNTAVEVNTSGNPYAVTVNRARFRNNGTGVRINGNNFATVTRNTFNLLTAPGNGSYICGLKLDNSTGYKVEGNRFIGMDSYVPGISRGIWVNNSSHVANQLYRNNFDGLRHGIYATGDNGGQTKYGLQLVCNTFNGVNKDIYVESGASIQTNQGSPAVSASNKFYNGTGFDIVNNGYVDIEYYYHGVNNTSNPHYPDHTSGMVSPRISMDTNTCPSTLCNNGGWVVNGTGPSLAQFQSSIAGTDDCSTPQGGANGNTAAWQALPDTYYAAVRTLMADTVLNLNELELWHTAAQPIADPYSLTETRFMEGYAETFTENAENAEMANYTEFHALKSALRDNGADNAGTVEANNYSPLQTGHPDINWYALTPAQIAQLQTIAERNTGRASVMAKGVLCFFFGICYEDDLTAGVFEAGVDDSDTTGAPTKRAATSAGTNAALTVYPNPTGDLLHIELSGGGGIASVALYDLQGRVVETRHGTSLQGGTATVNLRNVPAGVYLLRVRDAEGKEYMRKIVKKNNG